MTPFDVLPTVYKLSPKTGDLLIFRIQAGNPQQQDSVTMCAHEIRRMLAREGADTTWLVLPDDIQIEHVAEEYMASLGWVRADVPAVVEAKE